MASLINTIEFNRDVMRYSEANLDPSFEETILHAFAHDVESLSSGQSYRPSAFHLRFKIPLHEPRSQTICCHEFI